MSRSAAGAALTAAERRRQLALRAATLRDLLAIWPVWTPEDAGSWERFVLPAATIIRARNRESSETALEYFRAFRSAEGIKGPAPALALAAPPVTEQLVNSMTATGFIGTMRALRVGFPTEASLRSGFTLLSGAAVRLMLKGGRDTLVEASKADTKSKGRWARITGGMPCSFCEMLAGRGAVYSETTGDFPAHDFCQCSVEPEF